MVEMGAGKPFAPPQGFRVLDERTYGASRLIPTAVDSFALGGHDWAGPEDRDPPIQPSE